MNCSPVDNFFSRWNTDSYRQTKKNLSKNGWKFRRKLKDLCKNRTTNYHLREPQHRHSCVLCRLESVANLQRICGESVANRQLLQICKPQRAWAGRGSTLPFFNSISTGKTEHDRGSRNGYSYHSGRGYLYNSFCHLQRLLCGRNAASPKTLQMLTTANTK